MKYLVIIGVTLSSFALSGQDKKVEFSTKSDSKFELGVKERMENILQTYDLSKWIFTNKVMIEDRVIPHSHPVLTLNTRKQGDDPLLSTFIHEQLHWYLEANDAKVEKTIKALRLKYKDVPVGNQEGARDEYSTYLHLIVCHLEYKSMIQLIGSKKAEKVIREVNHYKWIYAQVLTDQAWLDALITKNGLNLVD